MSERQESTVKNFSIVIAILALIASLAGILGHIYRDDHWAAAQLVGQDVATVLIALFLVFATLKSDLKAKFIQAGVLGYFIYTYITYAFAVALNPFFLVYVAIIPLSIVAFVFVLIQIYRMLIAEDNHWILKVSSAYLIMMGLMLTVLWLVDIYGYLRGQPLFANPSGEPFQVIYALDLGIVVPASLYGAVQLLRKRQSGYIVSAIMLVKSTTMGMALIAMTIAVYLNGYELELILAFLWGIIGIVGLILTFGLLSRLKVASGKV